jgi:hypothetical protein
VVGLSAIGGMAGVDVERATEVENKMLEQRDAIQSIQSSPSESDAPTAR